MSTVKRLSFPKKIANKERRQTLSLEVYRILRKDDDDDDGIDEDD
jgi:hypothetical protein